MKNLVYALNAVCTQCTFHNEWQHVVNFHCNDSNGSRGGNGRTLSFLLMMVVPRLSLSMSDFSINNTIQSLYSIHRQTHTHTHCILIIILLFIAVVIQLSKLRLRASEWVNFEFSSSSHYTQFLLLSATFFRLHFSFNAENVHERKSKSVHSFALASSIPTNWVCVCVLGVENISCEMELAASIIKFHDSMKMSTFWWFRFISHFFFLEFFFCFYFLGNIEQKQNCTNERTNKQTNSIELESAWWTMFNVEIHFKHFSGATSVVKAIAI